MWQTTNIRDKGYQVPCNLNHENITKYFTQLQGYVLY